MSLLYGVTRMFDVKKYLKYFGFKRIRRYGENFMASCPDFNREHDRGDMRPSFGVRAYPPYLANCFSCGLRVNIETLTAMLLSREYDRPVDEYEAWKWLEERKWITPITAEELRERLHLSGEDVLDILDNSILNEFVNGVHPSILKRGISIEAAKEWELRYDPKTNRTIIPVRNFMDLLVGVLTRAVFEDEYIRHGVGIPQPEGGSKYAFKKGLVLFGENKMQGKDTLLLTEAPLDVIYCWTHGVNKDMDILALMGTLVSKFQLEKILAYPKVILAMDNDRSGQEATKQLEKILVGKVDVRVFDNFGAEDLGKVKQEDLLKIKDVVKSSLSKRLKKLPEKYK